MALEDSVAEGLGQTRHDERSANPGGRTSITERNKKTKAQLLRHQIILLAMQHGRAPLPVSPALCKSLLRGGGLDPHEVGNIARRFSFLGDGRMVLAELNLRTAPVPARASEETLSKEGKITVEQRP
jgi:hypothetical protein